MGDSERTSTSCGETSPVAASQTVGATIANNSISSSEVSIHNHYQVIQNITVTVVHPDHLEDPEQGGQCTGQQIEG